MVDAIDRHSCAECSIAGKRSAGVVLVAFCCLLLLVLFRGNIAQAQTRNNDATLLIDQEPFDRLTIRDGEQSVTLDVFPITDDDRSLPQKAKPTDKLRFRLLSAPHRAFEVEYQYVRRVETFDQMRLAEAEQLSRQNRFAEAFRVFQVLQKERPQLPGLEAAIDQFLLRSAAQQYRERRFHEALVTLQELHSRNPAKPEGTRAVVAVVKGMIDDDLSRNQYAAARTSISWARKRFPSLTNTELQSWTDALRRRSQVHLDRAREYATAEDWSSARRECELAIAADPGNQDAGNLSAEIRSTYPLVVVGMTHDSPIDPDVFPLEWSARRMQRLTARFPMEQTGFGSEGGEYRSPYGRWSMDEENNKLEWQLDIEAIAAGAPQAWEWTQWLLAAPHRDRDGFLASIQTIHTPDPARIVLTLNAPMLRPERLLTSPFVPRPLILSANAIPYRREADSSGVIQDNRSSFHINPTYFGRTPLQPREVQERVIADSTQLLGELLAGSIDVLERLHPADVEILRKRPDIQVLEYAAPSLMMMIPNARRELPRNNMVRRGLLYALDRERILREQILIGAKRPGAQVLSGPIPLGKSLDDPLAYAADSQIQPLPYDPTLGRVLIEFGRRQVALSHPRDNQAKPSEPVNDDTGTSSTSDRTTSNKAPRPSPIVLAYPAQQRARVASESIVRYWNTIGILAEAKEMPPGQIIPHDDEWDFALAEIVMTEPLSDVLCLFRDQGPITDVSPYLRLALGQVRSCRNWDEARRALYRVHELTSQELPVLPLWQVPEALACRRENVGIRPNSLSLYQDVEQWKIADIVP